jgi:hypothetical protein
MGDAVHLEQAVILDIAEWVDVQYNYIQTILSASELKQLKNAKLIPRITA